MKENQPDEERIHSHLLTLLSVSAAMVGVCLTAIGLVSVIEAISQIEHAVEDMLAVASIVFSLVTLMSFLGIRTPLRRTWPPFILVLDVVFCVGIATMVLASMLLTFLVI